MKNLKSVMQDILHVLLVFSLAGIALKADLQPLIAPNTYSWIVFALLAASTVVYFADVIFGFSNTNVPTPPNTPTTPTV